MIALTTPLAPPCLTAKLRQFQSVFQGVTGRWRWVAVPTNNVDLEPLCQSSLVGFGFAIHAEAHARKALRGWDVEIVRHDAPISAVDAAMETGLASGRVTFDHLKACQSAGGDSLAQFLRVEGLLKADASDPTQGFKNLRSEQARLDTGSDGGGPGLRTVT